MQISDNGLVMYIIKEIIIYTIFLLTSMLYIFLWWVILYNHFSMVNWFKMLNRFFFNLRKNYKSIIGIINLYI